MLDLLKGEKIPRGGCCVPALHPVDFFLLAPASLSLQNLSTFFIHSIHFSSSAKPFFH
jgi:hypothetical protein